ncbi:hypothetical protein E2C01_030836 [Portunus trituberculatus]|uniref:Uncharacterized protein n=1 Tax=Portunus trituberculatus TaxID=210409 RepID=A0A5B7ESX3_PORTR|nr:hypothetical protein [Portunus trituberculatus]
MWCHIGIGVW